MTFGEGKLARPLGLVVDALPWSGDRSSPNLVGSEA